MKTIRGIGLMALISLSVLAFSSLPAHADTAAQYSAKVRACRFAYGTSERSWGDWLDFQACLLDANTSFAAQQIGKFIKLPVPLLSDNHLDGFNSLLNNDIGTLIAQEVYLIDQITLEPTGISGFNTGIGNPVTPTGELYIFGAKLDDSNKDLEFNQLNWISLGSFQPNTTNWNIVFDTNSFDPNSLYTIAYTFENNPSKFFPDTTTAMGLKSLVTVDEIPPEPVPEPTSTLSLLALGTLGAASTLKRKLKPSQSTDKETTKVG
jgi:hypothetical protein